MKAQLKIFVFLDEVWTAPPKLSRDNLLDLRTVPEAGKLKFSVVLLKWQPVRENGLLKITNFVNGIFVGQ